MEILLLIARSVFPAALMYRGNKRASSHTGKFAFLSWSPLLRLFTPW